MGLKNYQYNKILRDYDKKQLENKHELNLRTEDAYARIPELKEIDDTIINAAMNSAKLLISDDESNKPINDLKETAKSVKQSRQALLIKHGFPEDYLELQYQCTSCKDTGYVESNKCSCFKQAIVNILYSQSNIKSAITKENFSNFSFNYYPDNYIDESIDLTPRQNIKKIVKTSKEFIRDRKSVV